MIYISDENVTYRSLNKQDGKEIWSKSMFSPLTSYNTQYRLPKPVISLSMSPKYTHSDFDNDQKLHYYKSQKNIDTQKKRVSEK